VKVLLFGCDGYLGFPLAQNLCERGHEVTGVDNLSRRKLVHGVGENSVTRIYRPNEREKAINENFGNYRFVYGDITEGVMSCSKHCHYDKDLKEFIEEEEPDAIANLAQIPAAPYSQMGFREAWETQENNIKGNLNLLWALREIDRTIPVVQIGTLGEFGQPPYPIPEGFTEDGMPAPKDPGSFYHASKVNATVNTYYATKIWDNLKFTEIMQGIVYGVSMGFGCGDRRLVTRFDAGEVFGTCLNRFTAQAVAGHPLTVYGEGNQKRGYISIKDSIQCITLALENPPEERYRSINQFSECYRVNELAGIVKSVGDGLGYDVEVDHIDNPRVEKENEHYYEPVQDNLRKLGFKQSQSIEDEIRETMDVIDGLEFRIREETIKPKVGWRR